MSDTTAPLNNIGLTRIELFLPFLSDEPKKEPRGKALKKIIQDCNILYVEQIEDGFHLRLPLGITLRVELINRLKTFREKHPKPRPAGNKRSSTRFQEHELEIQESILKSIQAAGIEMNQPIAKQISELMRTIKVYSNFADRQPT